MARIRTVKPEFWGDAKTARVSRDARLLFLGLLNESDDEGRQLGSAKRIAGAVFPNDSDVSEKQVDAWLAELEQVHLLERYAVDGVTYVLICGFAKHQRMSHPTPSRLPSPSDIPPEDFRNDSGGSLVVLVPDLGTGSRNLDLGTRDREVDLAVDSPASRIFDAWVEATGRDKARTKLTKDRQRHIARALKDYPEADLIEAVRGVANSPFNMGQNDRGTKYDDLDVVLRDGKHIEQFREMWHHPPVPHQRDAAMEAIAYDRMIRGEA